MSDKNNSSNNQGIQRYGYNHKRNNQGQGVTRNNYTNGGRGNGQINGGYSRTPNKGGRTYINQRNVMNEFKGQNKYLSGEIYEYCKVEHQEIM